MSSRGRPDLFCKSLTANVEETLSFVEDSCIHVLELDRQRFFMRRSVMEDDEVSMRPQEVVISMGATSSGSWALWFGFVWFLVLWVRALYRRAKVWCSAVCLDGRVAV